ncbi:MAG: hypothetical protein V2I56_27010 [Desulfobacteraceae bacterium]|jgi:hypothetical protein|nr:hypothetical protein [Desulfobacteraceae bacterium]
MTENYQKKKYEKPQVTRIKLDSTTAVLGFCKAAGQGGPVVVGCEDGSSDPCNESGS